MKLNTLSYYGRISGFPDEYYQKLAHLQQKSDPLHQKCLPISYKLHVQVRCFLYTFYTPYYKLPATSYGQLRCSSIFVHIIQSY